MVVDELIEDIFEENVTLKKIQPRINDKQSFDEFFLKKKRFTCAASRASMGIWEPYFSLRHFRTCVKASSHELNNFVRLLRTRRS